MVVTLYSRLRAEIIKLRERVEALEGKEAAFPVDDIQLEQEKQVEAERASRVRMAEFRRERRPHTCEDCKHFYHITVCSIVEGEKVRWEDWCSKQLQYVSRGVMDMRYYTAELRPSWCPGFEEKEEK